MRNPNVVEIQKQIRAFNKQFSRIDKAGLITNSGYALVTDLIDYDRMTMKGFAKAGTKYLENMTEEELLAYSADIEDAYDILRWDKEMSEFEISAKDPESLLWKMYNELDEMGQPFDSDDIKDVIDGVYEVGYKEMASKMYKLLKSKDYGLSDFNDWFQTKRNLS